MLDPTLFPQAVNTILITRLDGLDDVVLGTMLLSGLHRRWPGAYIKILVRPELAGVASILPKWVRVISLPFDPHQLIGGQEDAIAEQLRGVAEDCQADITIVAEYNRVWASEIIANLAASDLVVSFSGPSGMNPVSRAVAELVDAAPSDNWQQVQVDPHWREVEKYRAMLNALGLDPSGFLPGGLVVRTEDQNAAQECWSETGLSPQQTIVLSPGCGRDLTRTLLPIVWGHWAGHIAQTRPVLLLGTEADKGAIDAVVASGLPQTVKQLILPADKVGALTSILDTSAGYIGTDSGAMHIAAALGRPTLGVFGGGDRGERFLPVGKKAAAVRMPIGCYGCDWDCPFDTKLCLSHMPMELLFAAGDSFLDRFVAGNQSHEPLLPEIYDLPAAADLPAMLLGPMMRMHRSMHRFNLEVREHHDYLARVNHDRQARVSEMGDALSSITNILAEMSRQNRTRDETINQLKTAMAILVQQSQGSSRPTRS